MAPDTYYPGTIAQVPGEIVSMLVMCEIHKKCGMNKTADKKQTGYGADASALFI
jgi:hypothetical protein